ncbi:histidinol-phosphate transaminase [Agrobacterium vitis]|uniref:Histidinol-phosphate aminotransferase n=1 Tax=Agrobacterium vitis TaxID=373 RepID=A0A368NJB7_AGRVI|nr:histidinol-phosphate transaminase [Agrobacterium vitis]KAA3506253.1 histidinol-phosphate transaminase [Agrobacterium vitis]KAA3518278.1 histidinol-phosphate transaminase [Agrobacterium vitis]KAA3520642.1 histidinol-phosphate transaminase [Agrobacterium vitis]MBF2714269.1 histidinol-phosphate transaminase [Agrobacterium vitis]MBF2718217.1 histidinol-phosphate transaminase [Agrobacterium vitis]
MESDVKLVPNPAIADLPLYNAGMNIEFARKVSGRSQIAALASNENPYGCSPKVRAMFASDLFDPSRYPDPGCTALREAISARTNVALENIVVGNGSEEIVAAISRAYLVTGSRALTVTPSFGLHEIDPIAAGATVTKIPMTQDMEFDIAALEVALAAKPAVFFLPTPSNPVGCTLGMLQLERLAAATSPETLFVIDEAYFEFQNEVDGTRFLGRSGLNCVVLRTFSKAYGLAGLRVGYGLCSNAGIADMLKRAKPPFDVNSAAQMAATIALGDQEWMEASVAKITAERQRVALQVTDLGLFAAPSSANFIFVRTPKPGYEVAQALLMNGVVVKPWKEAGFDNWLRVSIGTDVENDMFLTALKEVITP